MFLTRTLDLGNEHFLIEQRQDFIKSFLIVSLSPIRFKQNTFSINDIYLLCQQLSNFNFSKKFQIFCGRIWILDCIPQNIESEKTNRVSSSTLLKISPSVLDNFC